LNEKIDKTSKEKIKKSFFRIIFLNFLIAITNKKDLPWKIFFIE